MKETLFLLINSWLDGGWLEGQVGRKTRGTTRQKKELVVCSQVSLANPHALFSQECLIISAQSKPYSWCLYFNMAVNELGWLGFFQSCANIWNQSSRTLPFEHCTMGSGGARGCPFHDGKLLEHAELIYSRHLVIPWQGNVWYINMWL